MKNNRFFIINHDLSNNTNDQVFYYTRIVHKEKAQEDDNSKDYPYYPFYLTFKPYRIDFNYYGPSPGYVKEEDVYQELKHNTIFSLPLSFDYSVNDRLTTKLIELFDEESKFDTCYIFNPNYDFCAENPEPVFSYNYMRTLEGNSILPNIEEHRTRISHCILFLDFLFDFNEVKKKYNDYTYCSFFDEIETRLRQNDFFNALATKYSYYYNQQRLAEIADENNGTEFLNSIQKRTNKFNKVINNEKFKEKCLEFIPEYSPITSFDETRLERLFQKYKIAFCFGFLLNFLNSKIWNGLQEKKNVLNEFISE
ncbi:MAG: hypothetical protein P1P88_02705, partial [Bacteroidales bacterium]|nr:hypothetical protein [Bacteroidales bacterium]